MVNGVWSTGAGYSDLENICGFLNMQKPMTQNNFDKPSNFLRNTAKVVAEKIVADATAEIKKDKLDVTDTVPSVDGSW